MATGTVKFFNTAKWFGFITPDDGSKEVFVHISGLKNGVTIAENDKVQYETEEGPKGINAVNVEKI
jgi:CspA family cold shock protein